MTETAGIGAGAPERQSETIASPPTVTARVHRRRMLGSLLERALTPEGYAAARAANWTFTGVVITMLGVISDFSQIFGDITFYGFVISALVMLVLGIVVGLRTRYCPSCAVPLLVATLFFVAFGLLFGAQELMAADTDDSAYELTIVGPDGQPQTLKLDNTSLLARFTGASALQLELYRLVYGLKADLQDIRRTVDEIDETARETARTVEETGRTADETRAIVEGEAARSAAHRERMEGVLARYETLMQEISARTNVTHSALVKRVVEMGARPDIAIEDIPGFLEEYATEAETALKRLAEQTAGNGDFAAVRDAVANDVRAGDLSAARRRLADARAAIAGEGAANDIARAHLLSEEAAIEQMDLNHYVAADRYQEAARLAASDPHLALRYRSDAANALAVRGERFADVSAVKESLAIIEDFATVELPISDPVGIANYRAQYGITLGHLARLTRDADAHRRAIEVLSRALDGLERGRSPTTWAGLQSSLGVAHLELGILTRDADQLRLAAAAFERQLEQDTREGAPKFWSIAKMHLGNTYSQLYYVDGREEDMQAAILSYLDAIDVQTRQGDTAGLATTAHNFGLLALNLGADSGNVELFDLAEEAVREALKGADRRRAPMSWAGSQKLLADILWERARTVYSTDDAVAAAKAAELALTEYTPARDRSARASTLETFGRAAMRVGRQFNDLSQFTGAISALTEAVVLTPQAEAPNDHAARQGLLGQAHMLRLRMLGSVLDARLAEAALAVPLEHFNDDEFRVGNGITLGFLAEVKAWRAHQEKDAEKMRSALQTYRDAFSRYAFEDDSSEWTSLQQSHANALRLYAELVPGTEPLEQALAVLDEEERGARQMRLTDAIADIERRRNWLRTEIARRQQSDGDAEPAPADPEAGENPPPGSN